MAAVSGKPCSALAACPEDLMKSIIVRNTFLDFEEEPPEGRRTRSASLPPSVRPGEAAAGVDSPSGSMCGGLDEDLSTDGGETGSVDSCSVAEADAASVADSEHSSPKDVAASICEEVPHAPPGTFLCLPSSGTGLGSRPRLSAAAKAFTPSAPSAPTPPGTRKFRREIEGVTNMVKKTLLACCDFIVEAEAGYSQQGWFVSINILAQHFHQKEWLLSQAKEVLWQAQQTLRHAHVLGCCAQPFQTTPLGFAARLGAAPDQQNACWNLLKQGFCRYGDFCHWQHPTAQTLLSVKVNIVQE